MNSNVRRNINVEAGRQTPRIPSGKLRKIDVDNPYSEMAYVLVGPEQTQFCVHLNIITNSSPFFYRLFEEAKADVRLEPEPDSGCEIMISNESICLYLPYEDANVFKHFNTWLYSKTIIGLEEKIAELSWDEVFNIYQFAVHRNVPGLQNAVVDATIEKNRLVKTVPDSNHVKYLYEKDAKATPFRKLLVDMFTMRHCDLSDALSLSKLPPQFLSAVIVKLDKLKTSAEEEVAEIKKKRAKRTGKKFRRDEGTDLAELKKCYYVQTSPIIID